MILENNSDKFKLFLKNEILDKHIPLIFVDSEKKVISQIIDFNDLHSIVDLHKERLVIFIREYDHADDY